MVDEDTLMRRLIYLQIALLVIVIITGTHVLWGE